MNRNPLTRRRPIVAPAPHSEPRQPCVTAFRPLPLLSTRRSLPPNRRGSDTCAKDFLQRVAAAGRLISIQAAAASATIAPPPIEPPAMNFNAAFHSRRATLTHSLLSSSTSGADPLSLIGP